MLKLSNHSQSKDRKSSRRCYLISVKALKLRKVIEFREGFRFGCDNELVLIMNEVSVCSI